MNNRNTTQLFWLTLVFVNKGLSLSGLTIGSKLNFTLQPATFSNKYSIEIKQMIKQQELELHKTSHVWWIDNYNKSYGQAFYRMTAGATQQLNWTGWAASISNNFPKSRLQVHRTQARELYPLLPDHIATYEHNAFVKQLIAKFWTPTEGLRFIWDTSFCLIHNITCVPLQPTTTGHGVSQADLLKIAQHLDGLVNFRPMSLFTDNVSSEIGLAKVLQYLHQFYKHDIGKYYLTAKIDINIFWRIYQVMF